MAYPQGPARPPDRSTRRDRQDPKTSSREATSAVKALLTASRLNLEVAGREAVGASVPAPGIPPGYPDPARLVTEDCIRAD